MNAATCPRSIDTPAWGLITCYLQADHGGMCQGDRPIAHPAGKPYYWYGNPQPIEAVIAAVEHAMFGAEEGGLVADDDSLPVGELRRLLREDAGPRIAALIAGAEKRGAEELQRRIDVVLAWHGPVESEYRDADGNVTRTVRECAHCSTLADDGIDWPCATASALGAASTEAAR